MQGQHNIMVKDNLAYLEIIKTNPEQILDEYYIFGESIIPNDDSVGNSLTEANARLIGLIDKFSRLDYERLPKNNPEIDEIVSNIKDLLVENKNNNINYTPFCQYFLVYNSAFSEFLEYEDNLKFDFLYEILIKYCKERHTSYKNHGYSVVSLQVLSDNYSHKRKGAAQIKKMEKMLKKYSLEELTDKNNVVDDLLTKDNVYFTPDKKGKKLFDDMLEALNIEMKARIEMQDKYPDFVFKHDDNYYIFELKSIKGSGGGQNQSMTELINFIKYSEISRNIHYCSFIDSSYANVLFNSTQPKVVKHRQAIEDAISKNERNYFLNTEAASQFFEDIFSS